MAKYSYELSLQGDNKIDSFCHGWLVAINTLENDVVDLSVTSVVTDNKQSYDSWETIGMLKAGVIRTYVVPTPDYIEVRGLIESGDYRFPLPEELIDGLEYFVFVSEDANQDFDGFYCYTIGLDSWRDIDLLLDELSAGLVIIKTEN